MSDQAILDLAEYGVRHGLLAESDRVFVINSLLAAMQQDDFAPAGAAQSRPLTEILDELLDTAASRGIIDGDSITQRDLFDSKLMGLLLPRPSEVIANFWADYAHSPKQATDHYYRFSGDSNYIRRDRIAKDVKWSTITEYGALDITINLSKPEKDPKAIAAALATKQSGYPKCALCRENEGYAGHAGAAARENHRIIPITLNDESWYLQYSPYVYYNEHCIVLNGRHTPMRISEDTFRRLLDFTEQFGHYFLGSNADLPIVGGSILTHDHFQGGRYSFPMEKAPVAVPVVFEGFEDVSAGIVKWPMSVLRIRSAEKGRLVQLASKILAAWRGYSDPDAFVFAETDGQKHNTITPIARRRGSDFELDLVLINNITTKEHPLGVFHPHAELHHIKKENIGLIEVMGLAVLPARLKGELQALKEALLQHNPPEQDEALKKHAAWAHEVLARHPEFDETTADDILKDEVGKVFCRVLEHAGVYKNTDDFMKFVAFVNQK